LRAGTGGGGGICLSRRGQKPALGRWRSQSKNGGIGGAGLDEKIGVGCLASPRGGKIHGGGRFGARLGGCKALDDSALDLACNLGGGVKISGFGGKKRFTKKQLGGGRGPRFFPVTRRDWRGGRSGGPRANVSGNSAGQAAWKTPINGGAYGGPARRGLRTVDRQPRECRARTNGGSREPGRRPAWMGIAGPFFPGTTPGGMGKGGAPGCVGRDGTPRRSGETRVRAEKPGMGNPGAGPCSDSFGFVDGNPRC